MDFFIFFIDNVNYKVKEEINKMMKPKDIQYLPQPQFPFDAVFKEPDKQEPKHRAFSMFFGISQVQKMRQAYERKNNIKYDLVIRFRYDIHLLEDITGILKRVRDNLKVDNVIFPFHAHHIGICDQVWFGSSSAMDKFCNMFDWIRSNLNKIYFVNENVIYRFIIASNIRVNCVDMQYILRRDHHIGVAEKILYNEYYQNINAPWNVTCPEKRDGKYQDFILNRNTSANTIYFFTRNLYCDVPCKLFNKEYNKFISVNHRNASIGITSGIVPTHFRIHVVNCNLVNIIVPITALHKERDMCLTVSNDKLICTEDFHDPKSQFYLIGSVSPSGLLIGEPKIFYFMSNNIGDNASGTFGQYLHMDKSMIVRPNGARDTMTAKWILM